MFTLSLLFFIALVYDNKMFVMRVWFSGRTRPCQGRDSGSIPGTRTKTNVSEYLCGYRVGKGRKTEVFREGRIGKTVGFPEP